MIQPPNLRVKIKLMLDTDIETYGLISQYLARDQLDTAIAVAKLKEES